MPVKEETSQRAFMQDRDGEKAVEKSKFLCMLVVFIILKKASKESTQLGGIDDAGWKHHSYFFR